MSGFQFKPIPEERDAFQKRVEESNPWWIYFERPFKRLFCDKYHTATVFNADFGMSWLGIGMSHKPYVRKTDDKNLDCVQFEDAVEVMCVEERFMKGWMEVVRFNQLHGRYRKAGTEEEYKF